jgi:hypothetical protein
MKLSRVRCTDGTDVSSVSVGETEKTMEAYKKMLADMARAIVDKPENVAVDVSESEDGTIVLVLSADPDDMGKVIGKHGKIAKAIRSVMRAAGNRKGDRVAVEIQ